MRLLLLFSLPLILVAQDLRLKQALLVEAHAADILSSYGKYEANPVLGAGTFGPRQVLIKSSIAAAEIYVTSKTYKRHPKLTTFCIYAAAASLYVVAVRNFPVPYDRPLLPPQTRTGR